MNPTNLPPGATPGGAIDNHPFMLNMYGELVQATLQAVPSPMPQAGAAVHIQPAPDVPVVAAPPKLCAGLDYANMKKEEAREEYKEKRRRELLTLGELDRVKRRKKNDTSMSDNQKYHRRLKMNQDSAAAARHAQDVYVQTLEELVATAETEKVTLGMEAANLRAERDELAKRLGDMHRQVASAIPMVAASSPHAPEKIAFSSSFAEEPASNADSSPDPASSALLLRKMIELLDLPETASASQNDADFARGLFGIMPAPAV
jgi:hypothetical protein